ncbi:KPN_02809 family neutral zinc metallopeptidase [Microbacterium aurantiacum]|uniref:Neutral zinc metallopeptidase n=1 Tax=Microbacterium aurantiacum TaxID=162393 RepID=A0A0M9VMC9_9MICO|nr:neutral zinc metallopeptidase [Microbacterium chocolatum]ANG84781.1 neutral zinc metallopeptidase [Microbacterium chocolatum]KOS12112.1 neutral zinc metallopeptidase [Microbacterium chocolatum]
MTFNDNARVGGHSAKRRGRGAAIAGGGVAGLGVIAVLLLNLFTGGDFSGFLPTDTGQSSAGESEIAECDTGADANARDDCRLAAATLAVDQYWEGELRGYRPPQSIIVDGSTSTPCGTASNQTGPFYCPADETVYIDPTFFSLLRDRFDATGGPLAQLYVLAHEYAHHVQYITGVFEQYPPGDSGPDSNGVRLELQADCLAGAWVGAMSEQVDENGTPFLQAPTEAQIQDALNAAATVGDDHIQEVSTGRVSPETWTHGSSEQRQGWFQTGYREGPAACDTFAVDGSQL